MRLFLALALFCSCTVQSIHDPKFNANLTATLKSPESKRAFFTLKNALDEYFPGGEATVDCDAEFTIKRLVSFAGIASSTFVAMKNVNVIVAYDVKCSNNLKYQNTIGLDSDFPAVQTQVLSDVSSEDKAVDDVLVIIAKNIHDDFKYRMIRLDRFGALEAENKEKIQKAAGALNVKKVSDDYTSSAPYSSL